MPDYPTTLPLPEPDNYNGTLDQGLIRTSFRVTAPNQVKGYNSYREDISMSFSMDNDTYDAWITWVNSNGYDWFNMPVVSSRTPTDITSTQLVRFSSDVQVAKQGDNWLTVTVGAELQPKVIP